MGDEGFEFGSYVASEGLFDEAVAFLEFLPITEVASGVGGDDNSDGFVRDMIEGVDSLGLEFGNTFWSSRDGDGGDAFDLSEAIIMAGADASGSEDRDGDCHP